MLADGEEGGREGACARQQRLARQTAVGFWDVRCIMQPSTLCCEQRGLHWTGAEDFPAQEARAIQFWDMRLQLVHKQRT